MGSLSSVIKALDVEKVVWIDDMFAGTATSEIVDHVQLASEILKRNFIEELGLSDMSSDDNVVETLAGRFGTDEGLTEKAKRLVNTQSTVAQARAVLASMQCKTEERTGARWQELLRENASYDKTLFLLDRNFSGELISEATSDTMLKETIKEHIISKPSNFCVVFTKEVGVEQEAESRNDLLTRILLNQPDNKDLIRFSVVAKKLGGETDEDDLSRSLRDKLAGVILYAMLDSVERSLERSVASIKSLLVANFPDVNKSVLRSSYEEGASEIEVLMRILEQKHRLELAKELGSVGPEGLSETLKRFRLFQLDSYEEDEEDATHEVSSELKQICRAEILSEGALINKMLLPIVPGDVFESVECGRPTKDKASAWSDAIILNKSYWMLLGQLCDIVPRKDGKSASNMAFLAPFKVVDKGKRLQLNQVYSGRVALIVIGDLGLEFDFRQVLAANTLALRLCSFNSYGVASLSEDDTGDDIWSFASLARAKRNALDLFREGPPSEQLERYAAAFDGRDGGRKMNVEGYEGRRTFSYPIRRVCRVREIEASDALASLERYWRRPAKPHEFV